MVKALDLQPNGNFPRTLEPCSQPSTSFFRNITRKSWEHEPILVFASNWDWRTKDSQLLFLERTCRRHRLETTTTTIPSKMSNNNASKNLSTDGNKFHQNTTNVKRAVTAEWLRRWTWNPMGFSAAGSNPARSVQSFFFSEMYSEEIGNTNQNLCSQATETDEPKILNYFSWKGHVGDSVWKRPPRQSSAKNRTIMQAKISPRTELNSIKIRIMSIYLW